MGRVCTTSGDAVTKPISVHTVLVTPSPEVVPPTPGSLSKPSAVVCPFGPQLPLLKVPLAGLVTCALSNAWVEW